MRRAAFIAVALAWGVAAADEAPPPERDQQVFTFSAPIDIPLFLGLSTLWILPTVVTSPTAASSVCNPCDPSQLNAFDRYFLGPHDSTFRWIANGSYVIPIAGFLLLDVLDVGASKWQVWGTDFFVGAELLAMDGIIAEFFRRAMHRPRPYFYLDSSVYPTERVGGEPTFSFFSGHTSGMMSLAASIPYAWSLRHPESKWRIPIMLGMLLVSLINPISRVISGDHFASDVTVGAIVGTSVGFTYPWFRHWLKKRDSALSRMALVPSSTDGGGTLSLAGTF